jgi:hypothetical protein
MRSVWLLALMAGMSVVGSKSTFGQVGATLSEEEGSEALVIVEIAVSTTGFGTLFGDDDSSAPASSAALMTLFPIAPPFTDCTLDNWAIGIEPVSFEMTIQNQLGIDAEVSLSNIFITAADAFSGTIGGSLVAFEETTFNVSADVDVLIPFFSVDESETVEEPSEDVFAASLTVSDGTVTLSDSSAVFTISMTLNPPQIGINGIDLDVEIETGDIVLSGPLEAVTLGDSDFDGDIDLADYGAWDDCVAAGDPPTLLCALFDFDADASLDLIDWGRFQAVFSG